MTFFNVDCKTYLIFEQTVKDVLSLVMLEDNRFHINNLSNLASRLYDLRQHFLFFIFEITLVLIFTIVGNRSEGM